MVSFIVWRLMSSFFVISLCFRGFLLFDVSRASIIFARLTSLTLCVPVVMNFSSSVCSSFVRVILFIFMCVVLLEVC